MSTSNPNHEDGLFFEKDFTNAHALWLSMAENLCVFGGSRAVNEWSPGSCDDDSDYDIYAPANAHCIMGIMKGLRASGVTFKSPFEEVSKKASAGGHLRYNASQAERLCKAFDDVWAYEFNEPLVLVVVERLRHACKLLRIDPAVPLSQYVNLGPGVQLRIEVFEGFDEYLYSPGLQVIRGVGPTGKNVQLMWAPRMPATSHILRFHSTPVQCFISPYASVHFYRDLSGSMKAWAWAKNTSTLSNGIPENHEIGIAKYRARGFAYIPRPPSGLKLRTIMDPGVDLAISTPDQMTFNRGLDAERRLNLCALGWWEWADQTRPLPVPFDGEEGPAPWYPSGNYGQDLDFMLLKYAMLKSDLSFVPKDKVMVL